MPTLPSPPLSNTPTSHQKVSNGSRPATATGSGSRGTRAQQNVGSAGLKHTKVRGGSVDEVGQKGSRQAPAAKEGAREKPPSKDGTVQRTAKEVEGLKDFVCEHPTPPSACKAPELPPMIYAYTVGQCSGDSNTCVNRVLSPRFGALVSVSLTEEKAAFVVAIRSKSKANLITATRRLPWPRRLRKCLPGSEMEYWRDRCD